MVSGGENRWRGWDILIYLTFRIVEGIVGDKGHKLKLEPCYFECRLQILCLYVSFQVEIRIHIIGTESCWVIKS